MTRRYVALTPEQKELKKEYLLQERLREPRRYPALADIMAAEPHNEARVIGSLRRQIEKEHPGLRKEARRQIASEYSDDDLIEAGRRYVDQSILRAYETSNCDEVLATGRGHEEWEGCEALQGLYAAELKDAKKRAEDLLQQDRETALADQYLDEYLARYEDFLADRARLIEEGPGDVWRVVTLPLSFDPEELDGVGRYWTTEKQLARPFLWKPHSGDVPWRFRARSRTKYIDTERTLEANLWGTLNGNVTDASEIDFVQHAPIFVYEAERLSAELHRGWDPNENYKVLRTVEINGWRRA